MYTTLSLCQHNTRSNCPIHAPMGLEDSSAKTTRNTSTHKYLAIPRGSCAHALKLQFASKGKLALAFPEPLSIATLRTMR